MELTQKVEYLEGAVQVLEREKIPVLVAEANGLAAELSQLQRKHEEKLRELSEATQRGQALSLQLQQTQVRYLEESQRTNLAHDSTIRELRERLASTERERDLLSVKSGEQAKAVESLGAQVMVRNIIFRPTG